LVDARTAAGARQRDDLVRMVSHDLRTPLSALLLQAQMLQRSLQPGDPHAKRVAAIIWQRPALATHDPDLVEWFVSKAANQWPGNPSTYALSSRTCARGWGKPCHERLRLSSEPHLPLVQRHPDRLERCWFTCSATRSSIQMPRRSRRAHQLRRWIRHNRRRRPWRWHFPARIAPGVAPPLAQQRGRPGKRAWASGSTSPPCWSAARAVASKSKVNSAKAACFASIFPSTMELPRLSLSRTRKLRPSLLRSRFWRTCADVRVPSAVHGSEILLLPICAALASTCCLPRRFSPPRPRRFPCVSHRMSPSVRPRPVQSHSAGSGDGQ